MLLYQPDQGNDPDPGPEKPHPALLWFLKNPLVVPPVAYVVDATNGILYRYGWHPIEH